MFQERSSEEPPVEVAPGVVDMEAKNTKRKHVFRLMTSQGQTYLLQVRVYITPRCHNDVTHQADDAPSKQRWMEFIRQVNMKHQTTSWPGKLAQLSPQSIRRMSSPQPAKQAGGSSTGSTSLLGRLKRTLKRYQQENDGTDYSSFTAFGQALKDCPVSPDNKVMLNTSAVTYM